MKKVQKIIGVSFFSLVALTFFLSLFYSLTGIGEIIQAFKQFKTYCEAIMIWFLDIGISITMSVISLITLIRVLQDKETDAKNLVKKNGFLVFLYFTISTIEGILTIVWISRLSGEFNTDFIRVIVLLLFEVAGAVVAFLVTLKWKNELMHKILGCIAYAFLFVVLILDVSTGGINGFRIAYIIFMFLVTILGVIHVMTYNMDFDKFLNKQIASVAVVEKKNENEEQQEEKVEEEKNENSDVNNI